MRMTKIKKMITSSDVFFSRIIHSSIMLFIVAIEMTGSATTREWRLGRSSALNSQKSSPPPPKDLTKPNYIKNKFQRTKRSTQKQEN